MCGSANKCWALRAEEPFQQSCWYTEAASLTIGRHSPQSPLISPMSPTFTKGLLKGAALAVAGAAALGAGNAIAVPDPCTSTTLGSFGGTCVFGNYQLTVSAFDPSLSDTFLQFGGPGTATDPSTRFFTLANGDFTGTGSLTFSVSVVDPSSFLTSAALNQGLGTNSVTSNTPVFSLTNPSSTTFNAFEVTSITGATYSLDGTGEQFNTRFTVTSDVPVPLPVVGAGLAFGFTRKLRKRAKSLAS
jgi:hypothetical protein